MTEYFHVETELAKARRNYVMTEQFYVAVELAKVERISIVLELARTESFASLDRLGAQRLVCTIVWHRVASRPRRPCDHVRGLTCRDRKQAEQGTLNHDRGFYVATEDGHRERLLYHDKPYLSRQCLVTTEC